jgi:large subunit ribosomal protein L29
MKKNQLKELRNMSKEELLSKLEEMKKRLFELKLKHNVFKIKNPLEIRNLRRDIARVNTILREKFGIRI